MKWKTFARNFLLMFLISQLCSCAAGEFLAASETEAAGLSIDASELRSLGLVARGGSLAIADETLFYSNLRYISMVEGEMGANPRLLLVKNGIRSEFAEVVSQNAIRRIGSSEIINLRGRIFSVTNDLLEIRSGKLTSSRVIDVAHKGDIVYVLEEQDGWYKIQRGAKEIGYVRKGIIPIIVGTSGYNSYNNHSGSATNSQVKPLSSCETQNTGDFSFTNNTDKIKYITVFVGGKGTAGEVRLGVGQTQSYRNLDAGAYSYVICSIPWSWYMSDAEKNGQILVEKCKSKTFHIKDNYEAQDQTAASSSGEQEQNKAILRNGYAEKNTGEYCFTNNTDKVKYVTVFVDGKGTMGEITLDIGQTQCFYDLEAGDYDYVICSRRWSWYTSDAERTGHISVEQCRSKTFIIK